MSELVVRAKIFKENEKLWVTSLDVAEDFGKEHKNVLQSIERLECSEEFNRLNFQRVEYQDSKGESRPMYKMTRDGFTFLAMGFTGEKAAKFKEAYIALFNEYEKVYIDYHAYTKELQELQKKFVTKLLVHDSEIKGMKSDICNLDERVYCLENNTVRKRKSISKRTKNLHDQFSHDILNDKDPIDGTFIGAKNLYEYDHFTGVDKAELQHTWKISKLNNRRFLNGKLSRAELRVCFDEYQRKLRSWNKNRNRNKGKQLNLFK